MRDLHQSESQYQYHCHEAFSRELRRLVKRCPHPAGRAVASELAGKVKQHLSSGELAEARRTYQRLVARVSRERAWQLENRRAAKAFKMGSKRGPVSCT